MSRRGLQLLLGAVGAVAVGFGLLSVLLGTSVVAEPGGGGASVDSEHRFYAAWYVVGGVLALRAARDVEREATAVRLVAGGFALGAVGRLLGLAQAGQPALRYVVLMVVEVVLAAVLVAWQAAAARAAASR